MNWCLIIYFIFIAYIIISYILYLIKKRKIVKNGMLYEAIIVDCIVKLISNGKKYRSIFEFSYQNESIEIPSLQTNYSKWKNKVGTKKIVYYNPDDSKYVSIKDDYGMEFWSVFSALVISIMLINIY